MSDARSAEALTQRCIPARVDALRRCMEESDLDAVVLSDRHEVHAYTGFLGPPALPVAVWVDPTSVKLAIPSGFESACLADDRVTYDWNELGTNYFDIAVRHAEAFRTFVSAAPTSRHLGCQAESLSAVVRHAVLMRCEKCEWIPIDDELHSLRRRRDDLDLFRLDAAIRANLAAYDAVREAIEPGVTELEVLAAGWRGATLGAGAKLWHDGDYRCGAYNGPARDRLIEAGELYIIDAWTELDGYWSDLSRVFSVDRNPTDVQQSIFDHVNDIHDRIQPMLRPGTSGTEIWAAIDAMLREHPALADSGLIHHAGHGIGQRIHEEPDINKERHGMLQEGDVVCLEPGGYTPEARAGVRIEHTYLIGHDGAENLSKSAVTLV